MKAYRSVVGEAHAEQTIERSEFISYALHAEGEEEAKAALARIRAAHPLATHVCYGYIADKQGNLQRFSDDGEPQGTAGMPILGAIKARELCTALVAVVRYFGGIKLGAGGLTRAYAGSAANVLSAANICLFEACVEIALEADYPAVNAALRFLEGREVLGREFGGSAVFRVAVREAEKESFCKEAQNYFNGKVRLSEGARYDRPFPER